MKTAFLSCSLAFLVAACVGRVELGSNGVTVPPAGDGGSDAAAPPPGCVDVDLASYDLSCDVDSDCVAIATGQICSGDNCSLACATTYINKNGLAQYKAATASITISGGGFCSCPGIPIPQCVNHVCCSDLSGCGASDASVPDTSSPGTFGDASSPPEPTCNPGDQLCCASEGDAGLALTCVGANVDCAMAASACPNAPLCINVPAAGFPTSCTQDSDCLAVSTGLLCSSSCAGCIPNTAINRSAQSAYDALLEPLANAPGSVTCSCPNAQGPLCQGGRCVIQNN